MLSTKLVGNVDQAKHYFLGHDNYYTKEDDIAKERSEWWGKGTKLLELSGQVDSETFTTLLKGRLPHGQQLGLKVDNEIEHRAGFDLTFSAPKSVSILALMGGDERILGAMHRAVDNTLEIIERACAQARITRQGITTYENTQNIVAAKFLHDLSREADPQLHIHTVVMNMTMRSDGHWRSLASQSGAYGANVVGEVNGFFERVRHRKLSFGTIFRGELAYEMKQLGYDIVKTGKNGLFEIEGISEKTIQTYSQRKKQIDAYMQEYGFTGAKAAAVATIKTRKAKNNINRETLDELWKSRSEMNQMDAFKEATHIVERSLNQNKNVDKNPVNSLRAKEAMKYAIDQLSETEVSIKEVQLINLALQHAIGENVSVDSLLHAVKECQKNGELIVQENQGEVYFLTKKLIEYEQTILNSAIKKHKDQNSVLPSQNIDSILLQQYSLNKEQKEAIKAIFLSPNQINALEGPTGTGKTYLIKPMMELAKLGGYKTILLSVSKSENVQLEQQIRTAPKTLREWFKHLFDTHQYDTVSHFIKTQEKTNTSFGLPFGRKNIIFVDNATLLSLKQKSDLCLITEKLNARLVVIGDKRATLTWQSGSPFTQIVEKIGATATLSQNMRIQSDHIKQAIADTLQGSIDKAFEKIGERILSNENKERCFEMIASHYVSLTHDNQKNTLILVPTKSQCEEVNLIIHNALQKETRIRKENIQINVLLPKSMKDAEYRLAKNYEVGQWVRFNEHYISLLIQKEDYLRIHAVNSKRNLIILENEKGGKIFWDPQKIGGRSGTIEVFDEKSRLIAPGETILWKRNHAKQSVYNGERLVIENIKNNELVLTRDNGKRLVVDLTKPASRHFDYGYATTPLQKYYAKADNVIAYQNSFSRQSHQRLFYKELSQASKQAWIYTENKDALLKNVQKQTGNKITALDLLTKDDSVNKDMSVTTGSEYLTLLEKTVTRIFESSKEKAIGEKTPEILGKEAVRYALAHLAEREAAFEHKDVLDVALKHILGEANTAAIQKAVLEAEKNGELIRGIYSQDGTRWTTKEAIEIEREIIKLAKQDEGKLLSIATKEVVEKHLQKISPKQEHAIAIREITSYQDRFLIVQGLAGTGKTTLLKHVEPILKDIDSLLKQHQAYQLLCLAPTHTAVKELKERGLTAQTLDSFLMKYRSHMQTNNSDPASKLLIAVDESSMASNRRMRDLLRIIHNMDARGLLIGDSKQYGAIESGKPFILLQSQGIKTIYLKDIERQKDEILLKAVKESYRNDFAQALKTLESRIFEVGKEIVDGKAYDNRERRLEAIRDDYLSRTLERRSQTLTIILGNEERVLENVLIRDCLKAEGELYGIKLVTSILVSRDMTEIERTQAANYLKNDKVRFNYTDKAAGIKEGQYLTVHEIHPQQNLLMLENEKGEKIAWQPPLFTNEQPVGVEAYHSEDREIMAGELIRWTRTNKELGLLSPELAKVESIEKGNIQLRPVKITPEGVIASGEPLQILVHDNKYKHWDHAYAITGYSSQSKTVKEVILNLESYHQKLTSQPAFIVGITREVDNLTIYTDDKEKLLQQILSNKGEKRSALETIGEVQIISRASKPSLSKSEENVSPRFTRKTKLTSPVLDAHRVTQMLHENAEYTLERVLGKPKEQTASQYRYGSNKGSLVVTLQGEKRGLWHDFQTGEGGNLLQLIAKQAGLDMKADFKGVLERAVQVLGASESLISRQSTDLKLSSTSLYQNKPKSLSEEQKRNLYYAKKLERESQPIPGSLAEKYLREHRSIHLEKWPESVRFHPAVYSKKNESIKPALLVIAKDIEGKTKAVQAIFLDENTAQKADVKVQKQTWGLPSSGASVDLSDSKRLRNHEPIYIAEGPETALSICAAFPEANVKITLGKSNFKNIELGETTKDIVLCLDNDGNSPHTEKAIHFSAQKFLEKGKNVWIAKPDEVKKDYNDLLKEQGKNAVKADIEKAIPYQHYNEKTSSPDTLKSVISNKLEGTNVPHLTSVLEAKGSRFSESISLENLQKTKPLYPDQPVSKIDPHLLERAARSLKESEYNASEKLSKFIQQSNDLNKIPDPIPQKTQQKSVDRIKEKEQEL